MGASKRRVLALLIAAVMIMTSAVGVFAVDSSQGGKSGSKTIVHINKGTIKVATKGAVKSSKGRVSGNTITGLKEGNTVTITTDEGKSYRWVKTVKITKNKKGKVTWKKVKGATAYLVMIVKNGKTTYKKVSAKKLSYKAGKGAKVRIRPLKGKYVGVWCKAKKVK